MKKLRFAATLLISLTLAASACFAHLPSTAISYSIKDVQGYGPIPYNFRVIDHRIFAGGHPLNPTNGLKNTDDQAMAILKYLKSKGVRTVIDLQNDRSTESRYARLVLEAGLKRLHVPMGYLTAPTKIEWEKIKAALSSPVYIHCKWGADRTGYIIAKYLVDIKGYTVNEALDAVSTGGSHAGKIRGMNVEYRHDPVLLNFLKQKD